MARRNRGWRELWRDADGLDAEVRIARRSGVNPDHPGGEMSSRVVRLDYEHVEDTDDVVRVHKFRPGVTMDALPGGRAVLLYREDGEPIWGDF